MGRKPWSDRVVEECRALHIADLVRSGLFCPWIDSNGYRYEISRPVVWTSGLAVCVTIPGVTLVGIFAYLPCVSVGVGYVCPGSETPRNRDWRRRFKDAVEKSGTVNFRWHDLRHTFAGRLVLLMLGTGLRTVQELMGHKRIEMTLRYSHLSQSHLKEAMERLSAMPTDTTTSTEQANSAQTPIARSA